jgi:hypothetical protein
MRFIQHRRNRDEVVKVTMAFMKESEARSLQMLADIWDPNNRVLPQRAAIGMNNVKAVISLLGEYDVLKQPLPPPERFIDPAYAETAGP